MKSEKFSVGENVFCFSCKRVVKVYKSGLWKYFIVFSIPFEAAYVFSPQTLRGAIGAGVGTGLILSGFFHFLLRSPRCRICDSVYIQKMKKDD